MESKILVLLFNVQEKLIQFDRLIVLNDFVTMIIFEFQKK